MSATSSAVAQPGTSRRPTTQLVGISLAYFMVLLDTTVLAVAEPSIMASLHTGVVGVGWATTIYTMALASTLVLGGRIADWLGAHRVFVVGVIGFGAVSLACSFAPTLLLLLLFRAVLGLCAAAIIPGSLSLIVGLYPDARSRGRAIGAWAAISGVAMSAGPLLGGWLVSVADWRAVFLINVPIALVVILVCRTPIAGPRSSGPISWLPHLGLTVTLAAATLAIIQTGQRSWVSAAALGLLALLVGYGTAVADRTSEMPIVPAALRRNRAVWLGFGWGAAVNYSLTTVIFCIPLLLPTNAAATGATLLPMTLLVALNPLATGRLVARYGPLRPIRMGFVALPIGLVLIAVATTLHHQPLVMGLGLLLCGLGVSWTLPALVGFAVNQAESSAAGSVGGILNATRQVGATVAAAIASVTVTEPHRGGADAVPFLIAAAVCALGLITAALPGLIRANAR